MCFHRLPECQKPFTRPSNRPVTTQNVPIYLILTPYPIQKRVKNVVGLFKITLSVKFGLELVRGPILSRLAPHLASKTDPKSCIGTQKISWVPVLTTLGEFRHSEARCYHVQRAQNPWPQTGKGPNPVHILNFDPLRNPKTCKKRGRVVQNHALGKISHRTGSRPYFASSGSLSGHPNGAKILCRHCARRPWRVIGLQPLST